MLITFIMHDCGCITYHKIEKEKKTKEKTMKNAAGMTGRFMLKITEREREMKLSFYQMTLVMIITDHITRTPKLAGIHAYVGACGP